MSNNENQVHERDPAAEKGAKSSSHGGSGDHEHYVAPLSLYYKIFGALIVLTGLTVLTSNYDFGVMNIVIAMIIAIVKASLVVLFFMQLKIDNIENKMTFIAAFVFLFIFITLTSADLFFRHHLDPLKVETAVASASVADQNRMRVGTPEQVSKGKEIFQNQCVSCHGAEGQGNGVAAAGLVPPPRNFTTGYWRYGGTPTQIFHTLTVGSPGTAMASYSNLAVEDRYALAHYVRSLSPKHPDDDEKTLTAAGLTGNGDSQAAKDMQPKENIPIDMAMEKLEAPDQVLLNAESMLEPDSVGAKIYKRDCASCHGVSGMGGVAMVLGQNPRVDYMTRSFGQLKSDSVSQKSRPWSESEKGFVDMVSQGLPGRGMPGMTHYSQSEWSELYTYIEKLSTESTH